MYYNLQQGTVQQLDDLQTSVISIVELEVLATNCNDPCNYPCYDPERCHADNVVLGGDHIGPSLRYCGVVNGELCHVDRCDYGNGRCNVSAQVFCDQEC